MLDFCYVIVSHNYFTIFSYIIKDKMNQRLNPKKKRKTKGRWKIAASKISEKGKIV